jgi:GNAT superfamily N-acetyltransferase
VGALQDVDRVDLEQADPVDDAPQMPPGHRAARARVGETLRRQRDPAGLRQGQRLDHGCTLPAGTDENAWMIVREAVLDDAPGITQVHVRGWRWAYQDLMPAAYLDGLDAMMPERIERRRRFLAEPSDQARTLVAMRDGEVVGFTSVGQYRYDKAGDEPAGVDRIQGEVYAIYVMPEVAGTGTGYALMQAGVGWLRGRGFEPIALWVLDGNVRARTFYERYGFRPDGGRSTFTLDEAGDVPIEIPEVRYRLDAQTAVSR